MTSDPVLRELLQCVTAILAICLASLDDLVGAVEGLITQGEKHARQTYLDEYRGIWGISGAYLGHLVIDLTCVASLDDLAGVVRALTVRPQQGENVPCLQERIRNVKHSCSCCFCLFSTFDLLVAWTTWAARWRC